MGIKHNNQLVNTHFRKDWARRVKLWFDQPGRKDRRRRARTARAAKIAPRPIDGALRPAVRCPTIKYNLKLRAGRGFSFDELKAAGIPRKLAPTIGIAVDHRRKNRSEESLAMNVRRLNAYRARLVLFPRRNGRVKAGDACVAEQKAATQLAAGKLNAIAQPRKRSEARKITDEERKGSAYERLRMTWTEERNRGMNEKRAKERAEEEANKVGKK